MRWDERLRLRHDGSWGDSWWVAELRVGPKKFTATANTRGGARRSAYRMMRRYRRAHGG